MITDRRAVAAPGLGASTWEAVVISTADYYPFGMLKPSGLKEGALSNGTSTDSNPSASMIVDISMFRANSTFGCQVNNLKIGKLKTYVSYANNQYIGFLQTEVYRYAYNGMETDNEVSGQGNSYTTEFRQYDPRLGRWKSLDPLMTKYPNASPYSAFNNNPIYFIDPYGLEGTNPDGEPEVGYTCTDESGTERKYEGNGDWGDTGNQKIVEVSIKHGLGNGGKHLRSLGGKGGGHVGVTLGDKTYGFSNSKHGAKLFGRVKQKNRDGLFGVQPKWDAEDDTNTDITTFKIPVTNEQFNELVKEYEEAVKNTDDLVGPETRRKTSQPDSYNTPYDYALINGKRCASSAFDILVNHGLIPDPGILRPIIQTNPGNVYRMLKEMAIVNNWEFQTSSDKVKTFTQQEAVAAVKPKLVGKVKKYNKYRDNIINRLIRKWYAQKEEEE